MPQGHSLSAAMARPDDKMVPVYTELAQELQRKLSAHSDDRQYWIALAGAPGSGKTTAGAGVVTALQQLGVPAVLLSMDGFHYYKQELDAMSDPAEAYRRRGAHWTFNADRFVQQLTLVKTQRSGSFPSFDHCVGDPIEDSIHIKPEHRVVIVEGNYLLLKGVPVWNSICTLFDETWFLQCTLQQCADRVVARHIQTGLTHEAAEARVESNDTPNAQFILDHLDLAAVDRVIHSV